MRTLSTRALVSMLALSSLGACRTHTGAGGAGLPASAQEQPARLAIRFDNTSRERVNVYLVGESREWSLGRVEAGGTAWLPLPRQSIREPGNVRIVAVAGGTTSLQAGRDGRGVATLAQPLQAVIEQRWVFAPGQLTSLRADPPRGQR